MCTAHGQYTALLHNMSNSVHEQPAHMRLRQVACQRASQRIKSCSNDHVTVQLRLCKEASLEPKALELLLEHLNRVDFMHGSERWCSLPKGLKVKAKATASQYHRSQHDAAENPQSTPTFWRRGHNVTHVISAMTRREVLQHTRGIDESSDFPVSGNFLAKKATPVEQEVKTRATIPT